MNAPFGLNNKAVGKITTVLKKHPAISKAIIYGSRAMGHYREGSDIDLTFLGDEIPLKELGTIHSEIDDLLLPWTVDISVFNKLKDDKLREHINRVGQIFYERATELH